VQRNRLIRAWDLRSYDQPFRLLLLISSTSLVLQSAVVTLTAELAAASPYIESSRQIGDLAAAGTVAMAISTLGWATLARRLPMAQLMLLGELLGIGGFVAAALAPNYVTLASGLLASYVGTGALVALVPVAALTLLPRGASGQALGVSTIASMIGAAMGTVLPSFMVGHVRWPIPMLAPAAYCLVGVAAAASLRIPSRAEGSPEPRRLREELAGWGQMLRVRSNLSLLLYYAVLQVAMGGPGYYLFTVLKEEYALSASAAMGVVMTGQALIVVGTGFWGAAADDAVRRRPDGRVRTLLASTLLVTSCQAISYAVLPLYRLGPWYLALYLAFSMLCSAAGSGALAPVMYSIIGDTTPAEQLPLAVSLRNLLGTVCSSLGIALAGTLRGLTGSYACALFLCSAMGPLAALLLVPAMRLVPRDMAALTAACAEPMADEAVVAEPAAAGPAA